MCVCARYLNPQRRDRTLPTACFHWSILFCRPSGRRRSIRLKLIQLPAEQRLGPRWWLLSISTTACTCVCVCVCVCVMLEEGLVIKAHLCDHHKFLQRHNWSKHTHTHTHTHTPQPSGPQRPPAALPDKRGGLRLLLCPDIKHTHEHRDIRLQLLAVGLHQSGRTSAVS